MNIETMRLTFTAIFLLLVFSLWQRWEHRNGQPEATPSGTYSSIPGNDSATSQVAQIDEDLPQPTVDLRSEDKSDVPPPDTTPQTGSGSEAVMLSADWLNLLVSSRGGDIVEAQLRKHAFSNTDSTPFRLLKSDADGLYIAQSGLIGGDLPNHKSEFTILGDTQPGSGSVTLQIQTKAAQVRKTISIADKSYIVQIGFDILNTSDTPLTVLAYHQLLHDGTEPEAYSSFLPTFFGAGIYTNNDRFNKIQFDDFNSTGYPKQDDNGWIGLIERYFMAAWLGNEQPREFFLKSTRNGYAAGMIVPIGVIMPGESRTSQMPLYVGAQEQESLSELSDNGTAPGIDLAVDYGFLTIIAEPMFWVLARTNDYVGNWGIAIIIVTFLIKLAFFPLSATSYRSMAKMRAVAPRLQRIKEKHGTDKQAMQRAMMDLYREEKINPFGGCLPILLQIPFFIALYWVLLGSVELRNAPFAFWINDLSVPDPWFVMSVLLGGLMFAQTKLNPSPPDPTQAMIIKFVPLVFTVFSIFFPAGLVLYWVVNTLLSILQQWQITRTVETEKSNARRS